MNELSLFTGAGGGVLGTKLLGFKHRGYVEINDYCQRIIAQRIEDGILDRAPIFSDIRSFISEGYAESYSGLVDVLSAGFPCQPFSLAGKRKGEDDERNMWPETIECIRIIRPGSVLLENVPGLLAHEYGRTIFRDLAESGYIPRWRILSAAEMGAPHKRDRLWIVAHTNCTGRGKGRRNEQGQERKILEPARLVSYINERQLSPWSDISPSEKSRVLGIHDGLAGELDGIKALGNGQVPAVVRTAWQLLTN